MKRFFAILVCFSLCFCAYAETYDYFSFGLVNEITDEDAIETSTERGGLELSIESAARRGELFWLLLYDFFWSGDESEHFTEYCTEHLLGLGLGYGLLSFFQPYSTVMLGIHNEGNEATRLAYKAAAGVRVPIHRVSLRADISYCSLLGSSCTFAIGIGF